MFSQLIYVSTANPELEQADIEDILSVARKRNADAGISGLLLYNGSNFLQYLEGPQRGVEGLFHTLTQDHRHRGLIRIFHGTAKDRHFSTWDMGYRGVEPLDADQAGSSFWLTDTRLESYLPVQLPQELKTFFLSFNSLRSA